MVDMAHDRNDRGARYEIALDVRRIEEAFLDVRLGDALDRVAHLFRDELGGVGVDDVVILCIAPCFISRRMTSTARSDMRLASS